MTISVRKKQIQEKAERFRANRAFVPATALAQSVDFDAESMHVRFSDGRVLIVPLIWFPILHKAKPSQRKRYTIGSGGTSLHWLELDEDLSISGLMAGVDPNAG